MGLCVLSAVLPYQFRKRFVNMYAGKFMCLANMLSSFKFDIYYEII